MAIQPRSHYVVILIHYDVLCPAVRYSNPGPRPRIVDVISASRDTMESWRFKFMVDARVQWRRDVIDGERDRV